MITEVKMTSACKKCGRIGDAETMFEHEKKPYCAECKPEGARPLPEYIAENAKTLTVEEAYKMANENPLEPLDMANVRTEEFRQQIADQYHETPDNVKLIAVSLLYATDNRKVVVTMKQFGGEVSQLLGGLCEAADRADIGKEAVMRFISTFGGAIHMGADTGEDTGGKKDDRPEFENVFG